MMGRCSLHARTAARSTGSFSRGSSRSWLHSCFGSLGGRCAFGGLLRGSSRGLSYSSGAEQAQQTGKLEGTEHSSREKVRKQE